jgi:hypothetical protein
MGKQATEDSENDESEMKEKDLDTAMKVVQIMQVVSEDLGDKEKRMWRKMLGEKSESNEEE